MAVRRTARAAAVLAATAVLVSACGNGDNGDNGDDDLPGVDQADEAGAGDSDDAKEESEEEEDEAPEDGEPVFDFPDNFEVIVDEDLTGDEEKDELLRDHAYALKAMNEGYVHQEPTDNFFRYWTAPIDSELINDFDDFAGAGLTFVGVDHFYLREIETMEDGYAVITSCEDISGGRTEDIATGEVVDVEHEGEYFEYRDTTMWLYKNHAGRWQGGDFKWETGSEECARAAE